MTDDITRFRVIASYVPGYVEPIRFKSGEIIAVGHRDQQWTAYLWCTAQDGSQGWVPETYLEMNGRSEAVARRDYDGTELTVARGEVLERLDEEGGWLLCRTSQGRIGWLPRDVVEAA